MSKEVKMLVKVWDDAIATDDMGELGSDGQMSFVFTFIACILCVVTVLSSVYKDKKKEFMKREKMLSLRVYILVGTTQV